MVTLKYLIFIMISCVSVYSADESSYKLLTYNEIINLMQNLTKNYPNLIKYESVHDLYEVPKQSGSWGNSTCTIYLATITDFSLNKRPKIKVYLSGNLHGDEKLGPNVLVYFAEYLVKNYNSSEYIKTLLK